MGRGSARAVVKRSMIGRVHVQNCILDAEAVGFGEWVE